MNVNLESDLEQLPDLIAKALLDWRLMTLEREKCEALLYLKFKGEDQERSATEIRELVRSNEDRYKKVLSELKAEANYVRLYERLLASKKLCDLRTAF